MEKQKFIQFFADKKDCYVNKLFCFQVDCLKSGFRLLLHFHCKGNRFRQITLRNSDIPRNLNSDTFLDLECYVKFFKQYDSTHYPSLLEAYNDYLLFCM